MTPTNSENFRLLSDEPIIESGRPDQLQFGHAAEVLARAALFTDNPITLGIYGNWGSGKTSLMRLMKQVVEKEGVGDHAAVPVWFNAWQYEREEHLIIPLIATIARDIKLREKKWEKEESDAASKALDIMKQGGKKVHDALRSVLYGISVKGELGVPLLGELEISATMKDVIERYEAVTQDTLMARSLYFDAFDRLSDLSRDSKIKKPQIVVFVDDLDRCFPEQAVKLLESIKLILHQPKFSFVLGVYPDIIEDFVRNKYASQYPIAALKESSSDDSEFQSRMDKYLNYFNDYLGKIVQVRYDVPERLPNQMQNYIRHLLDKAKVTKEFFVKGVDENELLELIAEVGERSPREIVRKINWLIVKWRITKAEHEGTTEFDLLAGLINETIENRKARQNHIYSKFMLYLNEQKGDAQTYGEIFAGMLNKVAEKTNHLEKMEGLKQQLEQNDSAILKSMIEVLEKDEKLCNILNSPPGLKWLARKTYREETHKALEEKEYDQDETDVLPQKLAPSQKRVIDDFQEIEHILPGLKWVDVKAGTFLMGSEEGDSYEKPVHPVKLDNFKISVTPITQSQYKAVVGSNPSGFKDKGGDHNLPVENVTWNDAMEFCELLQNKLKDKYKVSLPSEAQWEYAAIGGHKADTDENGVHVRKYQYAGSDDIDKVAWYKDNSDGKTHPVAEKNPNELGLHDMSGNVWEWCLDAFDEEFYKECEEQGIVENPVCTKSGSRRVLRGGSWGSNARHCRSASRSGDDPGARGSNVGFRLVFVPQS